MKKSGIIAVAFAALATLASTATPASASDSYGAIAYSRDTGYTAWAHSFNSAAGAENYVLNKCYQNANDCKSLWFVNACGAIAVGAQGGWGSAWAPNSGKAQRLAVKNCSKYDYNCRVTRWQCSGAR